MCNCATERENCEALSTKVYHVAFVEEKINFVLNIHKALRGNDPCRKTITTLSMSLQGAVVCRSKSVICLKYRIGNISYIKH